MGDGGRFQKVREERAGRRNRCKWKAQGVGGGGEGEGKGLEEKNPVEEKKRGFSLCFLLFFLFFFFFFFDDGKKWFWGRVVGWRWACA